MASLLNETISTLRKERGLTQEQLGQLMGVSAQAVSKWEKSGAPDVDLLPVLADRLGVTIDRLFGLDSSEKLDAEEAVGRWLRSLPEKERMDRFCRLVWACISHFIPVDLELPKMDYPKSCRTTVGGQYQITYSKIRGGGGILVDVHAEDMSFVSLWPQPKEGYAPFLAPMENYRQLFSVLAKPHCLELLDSIHWKKPSYFISSIISRKSGIPLNIVEELLEDLEKLNILWSMNLELEDGEVKAYKLGDPLTLVPFLLAAQSFMETCCNYTYYFDTEDPLLRGAEWKKTGGEHHEKAKPAQ